jgi:hypothetical protein
MVRIRVPARARLARIVSVDTPDPDGIADSENEALTRPGRPPTRRFGPVPFADLVGRIARIMRPTFDR